jgi:hypothetical protein
MRLRSVPAVILTLLWVNAAQAEPRFLTVASAGSSRGVLRGITAHGESRPCKVRVLQWVEFRD